MKNGNGTTEKALRDEIAGLKEKLVELTSRLQLLEGQDGDGNAVVKLNSRRDLLKLAGAVAAGAAGAIVLRPVPAAATAGNPVVLGADAAATHNDSNATTHLGPTAASTPSPLVQVEGQGLPTVPANPNAHSHQGTVDQPISLPLLLVVAPYGVFPQAGTPAAAVFPGVAPIQSVGGPVNDVASGLHVAEGVTGFAAVNLADTDPVKGLLAFGAGVVGESDNGIGVVGSGSTDFAAFGAGYIAQASITNTSGTRIAGPPPLPVYDFEQARDVNGALWLSTAMVTNDVNFAWRRMNTIIPINPFRIYDSRPNARPANSTTTIQIAGVNGIPADTIGVVGNLVAITPPVSGFLTMFPAGGSLSPVTSLNFLGGTPAMSNLVVAALGTGGAVSVFVSGNGPTNFTFDVSGYIR